MGSFLRVVSRFTRKIIKERLNNHTRGFRTFTFFQVLFSILAAEVQLITLIQKTKHGSKVFKVKKIELHKTSSPC